ncbi:TIGR03620 family F420-dependent LLM class oxidoreductase [Rhodococcus sp. AD45-ID]|uniref:LLM class F420-dependent oxidoreductase n=1 Tax=unclassified Rhodococcus (in: high G+C Gram-positive bacteria) TaxID=192944 RepID=UPI0005D436A7|nr:MULTISPECIES: LLM class F420-dependent oxidoreductase [unclassified Rhodococcus (in: high G+C Gram-positive bacteria)]KJF24370.1 methylenetetrahydromethanopterin reductase [Rhodococcus sp. AD45]PSR42676.1 TIGR03620 family F420-dependent LLM class oxidoreductase [Rhodococcus sp. AD45-ID]
MTEPTQTPDLGTYGIWRGAAGLKPDLGAAIEKLGFGTIWIGGSPRADLLVAEKLLDATERITVATGIVNVWSSPAAEVAESYHRLEAKHPGRFLLGIGIGHPEATGDYSKPYATLVSYLDELDAAQVPESRRVLAALGPKVLKLSADRAAGAHPYLTTPEHTAEAREILGPSKILAPEHKVVLETDPDKARAVGRPAVANPYLHLRNYTTNLERLGFAPDEIANDGNDRVIDALVAYGTARSIADRLREHIAAGADHVAIQALPADGDPIATYEALAAELFR